MKLSRFYIYSLLLVLLPLVAKAQVVLRALDAPLSVTLKSGGKKRIASIYDADYFPYNINPRSEALWQRDIAADGIPEPLVIDHQGKITTTGLRVGIPVTVQGEGTLPAYSMDITIPATYTEDGNSRVLRFSWEAQAVTPASTYIVASIRSLGGDLLIKKLDMNMGFGNDVEGLLMGVFSYPDRYVDTFSTTNVQYQLYAVTGIPDRCLGKTTSDCMGYGDNEREHDFIYTPVLGPDNKVWLGNNLGAEYAKYGSPWFDPAAQGGTLDTNTGLPLEYPTTYQIKRDWRAYGSLFQWQRKPDGHELINWSLGGTPKNRFVRYSLSNSWSNADSKYFIEPAYSKGYWVIFSELQETENHKLWKTGGTNNPCPEGYHVPSLDAMKALSSAIRNSAATENSLDTERVLRLSTPGFRDVRGYIHTGNILYWTSDIASFTYYWGTAYALTGGLPDYLSEWYKDYYMWFQGQAHAVRCIKD
ncbi:hypothetical protein [Riemerella anatipestifer]|uniref:hypothetical protein n=1 Tax=Riemerella anatipestifer TaxID=34085 RepID=UPI00129DF933|nr:hypothetical protein [Riemerella anatipestifer]MRM82504.1 hypothetical protein [Riemerella anatipestifer]